MTLHALRTTIGDEDFFSLLRRWMVSRKGDNVTTNEFIALAERISGRQLDEFFTTWLFTAAKPEASSLRRAGQAPAARRSRAR
jgi:aminopeptidase N